MHACTHAYVHAHTHVHTEAQQGGFFSYAAGAAHEVCRMYGGRVGGLRIHNHCCTLPMGKGLSSSAAISVMVRGMQ